MPGPIIRLEGVEKAYGTGAQRQVVLRGISLAVEGGDLVAIVGTSGSGKSTLLNIMGGLDRDYSGRVVIEGEELRSLSDPALARFRNQRIGFVFQAFNLLGHLTCAENVSLPAFFASRPRRDERAAALAALERVGLRERADSHPGDLSGGQKQRVAIARALYNQPAILLCDEPTGNLDSETGAQIIELFHRLNREDGLTLVIVTHESRVSRSAGRVVRIEDGRIVPTPAAASEAESGPISVSPKREIAERTVEAGSIGPGLTAVPAT